MEVVNTISCLRRLYTIYVVRNRDRKSWPVRTKLSSVFAGLIFAQSRLTATVSQKMFLFSKPKDVDQKGKVFKKLRIKTVKAMNQRVHFLSNSTIFTVTLFKHQFVFLSFDFSHFSVFE